MFNFFKNYLATILFIFLLYFFYTHNVYFIGFLSKDYSFVFNSKFIVNTNDIFNIIVYLYVILLIPFYLVEKGKSKARIVIEYVFNKIKSRNRKMDVVEKNAILSWLVKGFYAPLMIFWLTGHIFTMTNNVYNTFLNIHFISKDFIYFFNNNFYYMAFSCILFFDVLFFTIGYLTDTRFFKNEIKSIEPTIFGWCVALMCYPPFNNSITSIIGWNSSDFPKFNNFYLHLIINILILIFMGIYSRASISLGFKASNLTNRGIVSKGPYRYIRHPAYISKNIAWWLGGLPLILSAVSSFDFVKLIGILLSLSIWTFIYYLRAITEENHLSKDKDYLIYKDKVKYMFIPNIK